MKILTGKKVRNKGKKETVQSKRLPDTLDSDCLIHSAFKRIPNHKFALFDFNLNINVIYYFKFFNLLGKMLTKID